MTATIFLAIKKRSVELLILPPGATLMYHALRSYIENKRTKNNPNMVLADYDELYESHASADDGTDVIGVGDFARIGKLELHFLELAGLQAKMNVLDFGCGIGRLAQQLIPLLSTGNYLGVDISPTMILRAKERLASLELASSPEQSPPRFIVGDGGILNTLTPGSIDLACAFSVFTHMDLEDTYLHLQCLKRILVPGGILVCSHLLLAESDDAKNIFNQSSALPYKERRSRVLSVVTSREMIDTVAEMSGFSVSHWISGDETIVSKGSDLGALGQAVCFLRA